MTLDDKLSQHFRILPAQERALKRLYIETIRDLLYHFPSRYTETRESLPISDLKEGDNVVVFGKISGLKTSKAFRKKIPMAEGYVSDDTGRIKIIWFHQAYLAKMLQADTLVRVEGKVSARKEVLYFSNPKIENISELPNGSSSSLFSNSQEHHLYPIYPESRGITSNWFYHKIQQTLRTNVLEEIVDPIPKHILKTYKLPNLKSSLIWVHSPKNHNDALAARKRFSFQEIFFIQLERQMERAENFKEEAFHIKIPQEKLTKFIDRFPFTPTNAQERSIDQMLKDLESGHPMSRLLEGDVGSGKTAVAATLAYAVSMTNPLGQEFGSLQTAYMAPTEILAQQHFESFIKYFFGIPNIQIGLITGSGCKKFPSKVNPEGSTDISRTQLLKWVKNGEISILIGTHALIQKSVAFKNLALAIVDEQHRFGTKQRQALRGKSDATPHFLSMTATPIPRTLALTLYGDLDLTLLDEMPKGRKKVATHIVPPSEREDAYDKIRKELKKGRQLYVICPRILEPDPDKESAIQTKSVKAEAKRLKEKVFPEYSIDILHSKMRAKEKEEVMLAFKDGKVDILVSTSVVEVGVNVENASLIIIEGAERFGLAQLHQLRGRVLRGTHEPYCFIFTDSKTDKTLERLKALSTAKNGFELAEFDLKQRGAGDIRGLKQWGISDLGMEAIKNIKMVEFAREEASKIVEKDPELREYPELQEYIGKSKAPIHFE